MSLGAPWSRRLGLFAFVLMLTIAFSHRYGFVRTPDLPQLYGVAIAIAASGLGVGLVAYRRYWYFGDRGGDLVFWGLFWSLATLAPFCFVAYLYLAYPKLTDISTDLEDPPAMPAAGRLRTPDMNAIVAPTPDSVIEQSENYPLIEGRRYVLPLDRVLTAVQALVAGHGWQVTATHDAVGAVFATNIEALAYSPVLSLPADIAIRLTDEGPSTYVDMRSVSRYGAHDLGGNAARIVGFLAALDTEMAAQAGVATGPADDVAEPVQ